MKTANVVCNKLWDEIYVNAEGNVFACCHEGPEIIGNIYENKMEEIINCEKICNIRRKSIQGELACLSTCNLSPEGKANNIKDLAGGVVGNQFNVLKILFGERCNINCIMCWQDSRNLKMIDFNYLKKIDIHKFKHVILQGGEPFCSKEALDFADFVISQNVEISFLTNGLLITPEWAKKIAQNSDFIHISINAATKETHELINRGSDYNKVLENVELLHHYKEVYNSKLLIKGHMTIVKENLKEIALFIENFEKMGFDIGRFGYEKSVLEYLNENIEYKESLKTEIDLAIAKANKEKIDINRLRILGLA